MLLKESTEIWTFLLQKVLTKRIGRSFCNDLDSIFTRTQSWKTLGQKRTETVYYSMQVTRFNTEYDWKVAYFVHCRPVFFLLLYWRVHRNHMGSLPGFWRGWDFGRLKCALSFLSIKLPKLAFLTATVQHSVSACRGHPDDWPMALRAGRANHIEKTQLFPYDFPFVLVLWFFPLSEA